MGCANSIEYNGEPTKNDIMEFLIILKESDFTSKPKCANFHSKIIKYEDEIPGVLNCVDLLKISELEEDTKLPKFIFRDIAIPRIMYIKLPKENVYVKSEEWEFEYMKSQIQEIIIIFGLLGAKKITYDTSDNCAEHKEIGANLGIGDPATASANIGMEIKYGKSSYSKFRGEAEFPVPIDSVPSLHKLLEEKNLYYLPRKFHWKTMVRNRIKSHILRDKFDYEFGKDMYINSNLTTKFNNIGVGFKFGSNNLSTFRMIFDVEYHQVKFDHEHSKPDKHNKIKLNRINNIKNVDEGSYDDEYSSDEDSYSGISSDISEKSNSNDDSNGSTDEINISCDETK